MSNIILSQQCILSVDKVNLQHIDCPDGGAVGSANLLPSTYQNFTWTNISNGGIYGNGPFISSVSNLDAGIYVVRGTQPYGSCNTLNMTDTFEILEPNVITQLTPSQACPSMCNVSANLSLSGGVSGVNYTYTIDNGSIIPIATSINNLCGGSHTYEIFANTSSCGVKNLDISQLGIMNLNITKTNEICSSQNGTAIARISSSGASALNTYCISGPQQSSIMSYYSNIELVSLVGDNTSINNNTLGICDTYEDYTNLSADVTPGSTYSIDIRLSSCPTPQGSVFYFQDAAKVFIDWNIDGDFDDLNEEIGMLGPGTTPWTNFINFTVPQGAVPGNSRMRVVGQYNPGTNPSFDACDNTPWFGATEDYTIVVNGSVAHPISYLWSNGANTDSIYGLSSGTYWVNVVDANGCRVSDTTLIIDSGLTSSINIVDTIKCYGDLAKIDVITYGGTGWYDYTLNNQISNSWYSFMQQNTYDTATFSMLPSNNYQVVVTDLSLGCSTQNTVNIVQPSRLSITMPSNQTICNGGIPLSLVAAVSGGTPFNSSLAYIYSWSPASSFINANVQSPVFGTSLTSTTIYTLNARDSNNCIASDSFSVFVNPVPIASISPVPSIACVGDSITLTAILTVPSNLFRFQYNNTGNWINMTNPQMGGVNPIIFPNIIYNTQFRVKVREAAGCNTSGWSSVIIVPISNVVTQPINHY